MLTERRTLCPAAHGKAQFAQGKDTDESDPLLETVGLGDLRRKAMRTGEIKALLSRERKSGIPHKEKPSGW